VRFNLFSLCAPIKDVVVKPIRFLSETSLKSVEIP
jgi:hypothetical protein